MYPCRDRCYHCLESTPRLPEPAACTPLEIYQRTSEFGITFQRGSGLQLVAFADADYASKATDRRSVSGGAIMCAGAVSYTHLTLPTIYSV